MHFFLYASSTEGGNGGGIVPAATVRDGNKLAMWFLPCRYSLTTLDGQVDDSRARTAAAAILWRSASVSILGLLECQGGELTGRCSMGRLKGLVADVITLRVALGTLNILEGGPRCG